jgi:15-cis-phytoene synthase
VKPAAPAPAPLAPRARVPRAAEVCFATIALHSRSFALASRLLPAGAREDAAIVYTWCRRADDAVDLAASRAEAAERLAALRAELDDVYAGRPSCDVALAAFGVVARARAIPRWLPAELLAGMEMDVQGARYEALDDLLLYCFRAAGTVGLMMSHVMGVSDPRALRRASHLGIAMQLTNVCRDVAEDWARGRLYLPQSILAAAGLGALRQRLGGELPKDAGPGLARCLRALLVVADRYYRSGDAGLAALSWRSALAVRTARLVYAAIGAALARRGHDPFAGRAVVSGARKLALVARAALAALLELPRRVHHPFTPAALPEVPRDDLVRL